MRQLIRIGLAVAALLAAGAWAQAAAERPAAIWGKTAGAMVLEDSSPGELPGQAGKGTASQVLLMAQSAEQPKAKSEEKPKAKPAPPGPQPVRPPAEARPKAGTKVEKRAPAEAQMEKAAPGSEAPARAGTGKIGGTIIKSQDGPERE